VIWARRASRALQRINPKAMSTSGMPKALPNFAEGLQR
jgi:hypothetical protein